MRPLVAGLLLCAAASAGGGPETTLLVVNAASPMSRLVANEYAALRDIPRAHVVLLDGVPLHGAVPLDLFLARIWNPVAAHMKEQGLEGQIDLVVYSVDFPFAVEFGDKGVPYGGRASLTGLTFLIRKVEAEEPFWLLDASPYYAFAARPGPARSATAEERGFLARAQGAIKVKQWSEAAAAYEAFLKTYDTHAASWYDLACCLARLGKVEGALDALAKAIDHGFPDGAHAMQDPDLASLRSTPRFAQQIARLKPSRGYRAQDGGCLSTQLGYTGRYGSSVPEVLAALKASVAADGTAPDGTVYFCRNGDIRSTTREPGWPALEAALKQRGRKVEILDGVLPEGKDDVIGAILGTQSFSWASSKSTILPGAIVEHLTSHGGDFAHGGQTKLSELVRFGAAGASGTVMEPYAIQAKFPHPMIHAFYADGCSLAESFFLSVHGPYQLMVAGDGLARPFARFEKVAIDAPPMPWTGTVRIGGGTEVWVDGRRIEGFDLDTKKLDDGWHEVRVVKVKDDAIATRSFKKLDAVVRNRDRSVAITGGPGGIEAKCAGAKGFRLMD
ncbi:MAG: TPR end-of-group domain-containing protein, partial [Planctomycetota bacterium]